jgi:Protein of unknown function (DUF1579)
MKTRLALAALCLAALPALAANPNLKKLDAFAGTWHCKGTDYFPKPHATVSTVSGKWTLDGNWLDVHYAQTKTKENPMPFSGSAYMGYDAATKKFMTGWVDNMGGYEVSDSSGWAGDSITYDGTYHGEGGGKMRDVFTVKGNTSHHVTEVEQKGKWVKYTDESCTK